MTANNDKPHADQILPKTLTICLYVAGSSPNSTKALANLKEIIRQFPKDELELEIVDVLIHPRRALADGVLVTPSLVKLSPPPTATIVGDLRHKLDVLQQLGISDGLR